jgi:hypothetical protein
VKLAYKTAPIPPMAKENIKLSISKPVRPARLNRDGGFQYPGTNRGSVKPKGIVHKLTKNISFLIKGLAIKITNHIPNKNNENINHSFIILISFSVLSKTVIIPKKAHALFP